MNYPEAEIVYKKSQVYRGKKYINKETNTLVIIEDIDLLPHDKEAQVLFVVGPETDSADDMYFEEMNLFFMTHEEVKA